MLRPSAWEDLKELRGNLRRQIIKAIDSLEQDLRPSESRQLTIADDQREVQRLRLGHWRILYLILDDQPLILAIRRRPLYDYADLTSLVEDIE
jgi:mRNA-degrading endonuclease RelE of RelBE toxin-antitoxin system